LCDCEYDVRGEWTHLSSHAKRTLPLDRYLPVQTDFFIPVGAVPFTTPSSNRNIDYDALDLLWGYSFFKCSSFLTINGGLHWAKINFDESFRFVQANLIELATGEFISNMHGIGPELGLIGKWLLPFCWNSWVFLNGRVEGAMLFSRIDSMLRINELSGGVVLLQDISNDNRDYVVPHWLASIGLSIEKLCFMHMSAEIGYTIIGYHHALDIIGVVDDSVSEHTYDFRDNIYFHGLYVTVGITY